MAPIPEKPIHPLPSNPVTLSLSKWDRSPGLIVDVLIEACVVGLPVSGITVGTTFLVSQQHGPELWTGGTYGPEIGLLAIGARFLGILLVVLWVRVRTGKITLREQIARF